MDLRTAQEELDRILERTTDVLGTIRTGRASPAIVEHLLVDYYETRTPLRQLASLSVPEAKTLLIQPWDPKSVKAIERAIQTADLGVHPVVDGVLLRLTFPPMTQERRLEQRKIVRTKIEEAKVAARRTRDATIKQLRNQERDGRLSEDARQQQERAFEKVIETFGGNLTRIAAEKEQELMTI